MNHNRGLENLYCGTLCQVKRPGGKNFWHLTWKENGRTVTRYVRLAEVPKIKKGIEAYQKAKADLQRVATANLGTLMKGRTHGH